MDIITVSMAAVQMMDIPRQRLSNAEMIKKNIIQP